MSDPHSEDMMTDLVERFLYHYLFYTNAHLIRALLPLKKHLHVNVTHLVCRLEASCRCWSHFLKQGEEEEELKWGKTWRIVDIGLQIYRHMTKIIICDKRPLNLPMTDYLKSI